MGGVACSRWNVGDVDQVAELTAALRAENGAVRRLGRRGGWRRHPARGRDRELVPGNAALGVVDDVALTEHVAAGIGSLCARAGVNLDLAPVADVNSNPANPVIGIRSFGADAGLVARHVAAFVEGLQRCGVAACAKHFPGHGDTAQDSHHELPRAGGDLEVALVPFRAAVAAGVKSIMTAHIVVPSSASCRRRSAAGSLTDLLRGELGFDGLVVTDALEMRGLADSVGIEEGAVHALAAGADALCLGHDLADDAVESVCDAIVAAVESRRLAPDRLADACRRVADVAQWACTRGRSTRTSGRARRGAACASCRRRRRVGGATRVVELLAEPNIAAGPRRALARHRCSAPGAAVVS